MTGGDLADGSEDREYVLRLRGVRLTDDPLDTPDLSVDGVFIEPICDVIDVLAEDFADLVVDGLSLLFMLQRLLADSEDTVAVSFPVDFDKAFVSMAERSDGREERFLGLAQHEASVEPEEVSISASEDRFFEVSVDETVRFRLCRNFAASPQPSSKE